MDHSAIFDNNSHVTLHEAEWREFIHAGLPFTVFLSVLAVTGTLGNAMVFLTNLRSNKQSNYRILIQSLALVDFLSCSVGISGYIIMARFRYTIESDILCKVSTVFYFCVGISSLTILSFTAIERYKKTCKPFGHQFSLRQTKIICVCLVGFGLILSLPSAFAFSSVPVKTKDFNLTGYRCMLKKDRTFPKIYHFVFAVCLILCVLINTIFYVIVGKTIMMQGKLRPRTVSFRCKQQKYSYVKRVDNDDGQLPKEDAANRSRDNDGEQDKLRRSVRLSGSSVQTEGTHSDEATKRATPKGRSLYEKSVQISLMFLVCSILSCSSFIPLLVFRCLESYDWSMRMRIFESLGPMAGILYRLHVVNHVINPIVYCLINRNFRTEYTFLFKCRKDVPEREWTQC